MHLTWNNVDLLIPNTNKSIADKYLNLIKNCSGEINSGEIMAIMGPSGGGKSTLLNALFGKIPKGTISSGEILYNNEERNLYNWIKKVGFVDQDDVVNEDLTVEETLKFAALLRLDRKKLLEKHKYLTFERIVETKVDNIIKLLKLGKCSKNKMKKVSGGERKRAMIGVELISEPDILMLDEPTSGLDANIALSLINLLKEMAFSQNKIVIITIHQPSLEIFNNFDRLIVLSDGTSIYNDKISNVDDFLRKSNVKIEEGVTKPELLLKMCSDTEYIYDTNNKYDKCDNFFEEREPIPKSENDLYFDKSFDLYSIGVLISREILIAKKRKWEFTKVRLAIILSHLSLLVPIFIFKHILNMFLVEFMHEERTESHVFFNQSKNAAYIYYKNLIAYISIKKNFFNYIFIFIYIFQMRLSAETFMKRWKILKREVAVGSYSITNLYFAVFIYHFVFGILLSTFYCICTAIFAPQIFSWVFITTFILIYIISISIGLFVGAASTKIFTTIMYQTIFTVLIALQLILINASTIQAIKKGDLFKNFSKNIDKILNCIVYIFYLLPSLHHSNLVLFQIYQPIKDKIGVTDASDYNEFSAAFALINEVDIYKAIKYFTLGLKPSIPILSIFIFVTFIPYPLLGYYLLGRNLSPDVRMKLEKK